MPDRLPRPQRKSAIFLFALLGWFCRPPYLSKWDKVRIGKKRFSFGANYPLPGRSQHQPRRSHRGSPQPASPTALAAVFRSKHISGIHRPERRRFRSIDCATLMKQNHHWITYTSRDPRSHHVFSNTAPICINTRSLFILAAKRFVDISYSHNPSGSRSVLGHSVAPSNSLRFSRYPS